MRTRSLIPCVEKALSRAVKNNTMSYESEAAIKLRFIKFQGYLDEIGYTGKLIELERSHILDYARTLEKYSTAYKHNLISAVNIVLRELTSGNWIPVTSVKDCGFKKRNFTRQEPPLKGYDFNIQEIFNSLFDSEFERASVLAQTSLLFGLRLKEAALLNYEEALHNLKETGYMNIEFGTKGGRPRTFESKITDLKLETLKRGSKLQGEHFSIIPEDVTWIQFKRSEIKGYRILLKKLGINSYRELRSLYACNLYYEYTSNKPPIYGGVTSKDEDISARIKVSEDLGHKRKSISNAYLGSKKHEEKT